MELTTVWKKLVSALSRSAALFLLLLLFYLFPSPKHRTELEMRTEESFPFVRLLQRWNRFHSYFSLLTVRFSTTLELALRPLPKVIAKSSANVDPKNNRKDKIILYSSRLLRSLTQHLKVVPPASDEILASERTFAFSLTATSAKASDFACRWTRPNSQLLAKY